MITLNEIKEEAIKSATDDASNFIRKIVLEMLGFEEDSWGRVTIKNKSNLIQDIESSPEFQHLRNRFKSELVNMIGDDFTIKGKRQMLTDIRNRAMWIAEEQIKEEVADELAARALEIIKTDPTVAPMAIAAKLVSSLNR